MRHDRADLRRLAELGIAVLDWRKPPARSLRTVTIDSDETASSMLKDIFRGLGIAGISARWRDEDSSFMRSADSVIIRFGTVEASQSHDHGKVTSLPTLADMRGNASAKRQAWSQLRTLLRH